VGDRSRFLGALGTRDDPPRTKVRKPFTGVPVSIWVPSPPLGGKGQGTFTMGRIGEIGIHQCDPNVTYFLRGSTLGFSVLRLEI